MPPPLPLTAPPRGCCYYCVSSGRNHLPLQVGVHAASQSIISKARAVSRAGSLCGGGSLYPQKEPLPGAKVTRVARNTDAFSWWQHCSHSKLPCQPSAFLFWTSSPLRYDLRIREFVAYWCSGFMKYEQKRIHTLILMQKKKKADILLFGGNIKEYSKNCLNKALCSFLWHTWIFIAFRR